MSETVSEDLSVVNRNAQWIDVGSVDWDAVLAEQQAAWEEELRGAGLGEIVPGYWVVMELPPLSDEIMAKIDEICSRPWMDQMHLKPEVNDHNRAMLREALLLGARGYYPMPAHRPHREHGYTANGKRFRSMLKQGRLPTVEDMAKWRKKAKMPVGDMWQKRASSDLETIWTNFNEYPVAIYKKQEKTGEYETRRITFAVNLCLVQGLRTGTAAVDVDKALGRENWARLIEENGELPETPRSEFGSGEGDHYLFALPEGVELHNTANKFGEHFTGTVKGDQGTQLDIRSLGGQIIIAPSEHQSGGSYKWVHSPHTTPVAPMPDWIVQEAIRCSKVAQQEQAARDGTTASKEPKQPREKANTDDGYEDGYEVHALPSGWRNRVAQIGYGEGTANGCHYPIQAAGWSFFYERGYEADVAELRAALLARLKEIVAAYPDKASYIDELSSRIEDARTTAKEAGFEPTKKYGFSTYEEATDAARSLRNNDILAAEAFVERLVLTRGLSDGQLLVLRDEATNKKSGLTAANFDKLLRKKIKSAQRPVKVDTEEMNRHCVIYTGPTKVEFLVLSDTPGRLPAQYDLQNFKLTKLALTEIGTTENGTSIYAGPAWIEDVENRREVDRMDFAPPGAPPLPPGTLNLWNGFPILADMSEYSEEQLRQKCGLFLSYVLDVLVDGDKKGAHWVHDWVAHIFKHPGEKLGCNLAFVGLFGGGKSTFYEVLWPAFGDYLLKMNSLQQLTGQFNEHRAAKLLQVSEEVSNADDEAASKQQRDEATSEKMLVNPKFRSAFVLNDFSRKLYLGNDLKKLMRLDEGDRRVTVFRTSTKFEVMRTEHPEQQQAYFSRVRACMAGEGLPAYMELLRRRDITSDLRNPLDTEARRQMIGAQKDKAHRWCHEAVKLKEFGSSVRDPGNLGETLAPVYLTGPKAHVVEHDGLPMVALPQAQMRLHFRAEIDRSRKDNKYNSLDGLGDLLAEQFGADPIPTNAKIDGESRKCWFVPLYQDVLKSWAEKKWVTEAEKASLMSDVGLEPVHLVPTTSVLAMAEALRGGDQASIHQAWAEIEKATKKSWDDEVVAD